MPNSEATKAAKRRYRERNRETLREKNRLYMEQKRRAAGIPVQGSAESSANRRRARKVSGDEHGRWAGDAVGYFGLHTWVNRHATRTGICSNCGASPDPPKRRIVGTEWANISGEYRRDLSDYIELCVPCHRRFDHPIPPHGTSNRYDHHGCRCDDCRRANTDRRRPSRIRGVM